MKYWFAWFVDMQKSDMICAWLPLDLAVNLSAAKKILS